MILIEVLALAVAVIILVSLSLTKVSSRIGLPTLAVFIGLGMVFGQDGLFRYSFDDYSLTEQVCTLALALIMFYGGFGTNWEKAKPTAKVSVLLSSAGVVLTALLTGVFCHFVLGVGWMHGLLVGAVISSTDAASVFNVLRSRKLNLKHHTASLLEVESGSNDPFAYMMTIILLSILNGDANFWQMLLMLLKQLIFGAGIGAAVAFGAGYLFRHVSFDDDSYDSILMFGVAALSYGLSAYLGGNGYLSVYLTGIILGNMPLIGKKSLMQFFNGATGLVQIMIFFLLGLLSTPSELPQVTLPGLAIALFLTFIGRPAAVFALTLPFKSPRAQQLLVSWCGLRGASSIVFAIMATVMSPQTPPQLFNTIFFIVLFSIIIQGTLIPLIAKRLDMIDDSADVMKTFSDYTEQVPIQYLKLTVDENHAWTHKALKSLQMLPQTRVAMVIRDKVQLIPRGDTEILPGDTLIVAGPAFDGSRTGSLTEMHIAAGHEWCGRALRDINMDSGRLIIMVLRGKETIIPDGQTVLQEGDVLVMNESRGAVSGIEGARASAQKQRRFPFNFNWTPAGKKNAAPKPSTEESESGQEDEAGMTAAPEQTDAPDTAGKPAQEAPQPALGDASDDASDDTGTPPHLTENGERAAPDATGEPGAENDPGASCESAPEAAPACGVSEAVPETAPEGPGALP